MINTLLLNVKQYSRLTFWRITAFLIDHAVRHKSTIHALWPYLRLIGFGVGGYVLGLIVGSLVKALLL